MAGYLWSFTVLYEEASSIKAPVPLLQVQDVRLVARLVGAELLVYYLLVAVLDLLRQLER
jgi:hypothetical protein